MRRTIGVLCCLVLLTACGSPAGDGGLPPTPTPAVVPAAAFATAVDATATRATPSRAASATAIPPRPGPPATPGLVGTPGTPAAPGTPGTPTGGIAAGATPSGGATVVQLFAPFRPAGLAGGLRVTADLRGYCWGGSQALGGRPDAWRCTGENRILDPCFEAGAPEATALACSASPWSDEIVLLTLTAPLPRERANAPGGTMPHPWAIQLASGVRCQIATGATATVAGLRVNATCSDGSATLGDLDRGRARWRVFVMRDNSPTLEQQEIVAAWY